MKVGQRWWHVPSQRVMLVEAINGGLVQGREDDGGVNRWENDDQKMREFGWQLLAANRVYQHGDKLFVTLDATRRMRNLRTGLIIRPRVPFKYLGEMPQVGQVWLWKSRRRTKRIVGIDGTTVHVIAQNGEKGVIPLVGLLRDHTLQSEPDFHFATGHKDAIKAGPQDRRSSPSNVGASDSLVICRNDGCYLVYKKGPAKCPYCCGKKLPIAGQLWAKGSRYVTVDRVEGGRVHYTGGSSGLRRFLNEYANVTNTGGRHSRERLPRDPKLVASAERGRKIRGSMSQVNNDPFLFVDVHFTAHEYGSTSPVPPRPFTTSGAISDKEAEIIKAVWEHAYTGKGHMASAWKKLWKKVKALSNTGTPNAVDGARMFVRQFGRSLRPSPTTENTPCPLNTATLNRPIGTVASCKRTEKGLNIVFKINDNDVERVRLSIRKAQLKQELRTVARRLKELSK